MGKGQIMRGRKLTIDDITDLWLKEHDPYYNDMDKNKRKKIEYSYETERMELTRKRRVGELPFSSCWKSTLYKVAERGVDVKPYFDKFED